VPVREHSRRANPCRFPEVRRPCGVNHTHSPVLCFIFETRSGSVSKRPNSFQMSNSQQMTLATIRYVWDVAITRLSVLVACGCVCQFWSLVDAFSARRRRCESCAIDTACISILTQPAQSLHANSRVDSSLHVGRDSLHRPLCRPTVAACWKLSLKDHGSSASKFGLPSFSHRYERIREFRSAFISADN